MATRKRAAPQPSASGLKADSVRGFLLQAAELTNWTPAYAASTLGVDAKTIHGALASLAMVGYIEPDPEDPKKKWRTTEAGNAVAGVTKAKAVTRKTVDKSLQQLLERIREVNIEKHYLFAVDKAVVFGPFLTGADKLKNVDIALDLRPKIANEKKLQESVKADAQRAEEEGKKFKSYANRREWGKNKVRNYLKGRARAIALSDLKESILAQPHEVIFQR